MKSLVSRFGRTSWRLLRGHPETRAISSRFTTAPAVLFAPSAAPAIGSRPGERDHPHCGRIDTLKEAIASVDDQSYPHWEHLIVSDGYYPTTQQLKASNCDPQRRYFSTPAIRHFGNHQRNVGIFHARGEYLVFLDDDNVLYPEALATMLSGFTSGDVGLVLCPIDYDHSKHGVVGQVLIPHDGFSRGEVDSLNAMICRSLAVKCRGWGDSYFADFDLLHQAASLSPARFLSSPPIGHHR